MNTFNRKIFAIINATREQVIMDVPWSGTFLRNIPTSDGLFSKLPLGTGSFVFERRDADYESIQYYESFERAEQIVKSVSSRDDRPILDPLIIVTFNVEVTIEETPMFQPEALKNIKMFENFERDAALLLDVDVEAVKRYRKGDFTGYTYPRFQKSFEGWMKTKDFTL